MAVFLFKQKTAYEMRISDWSSDVCSSDLLRGVRLARRRRPKAGVDRSAHREDVREIISPVDLPGEFRAEVRVILVAAGKAELERVGEIAFERRIGGPVDRKSPRLHSRH